MKLEFFRSVLPAFRLVDIAIEVEITPSTARYAVPPGQHGPAHAPSRYGRPVSCLGACRGDTEQVDLNRIPVFIAMSF